MAQAGTRASHIKMGRSLIILGDEKRLFQDGGDRLALRLVEVRQVGSGIIILIYLPG